MKKTVFIPVVLLLLLQAISCRKPEAMIHKLNHGNGRWDIVSVVTEDYDTTGVHVIADTMLSNPGELVFFTSPTLDELFDYYLCVANMKDQSGTIVSTEPFEIYFDDLRADLNEGPAFLTGNWTVNESSRKKQDWSIYFTRGDGSLARKMTMTLKKQ